MKRERYYIYDYYDCSLNGEKVIIKYPHVSTLRTSYVTHQIRCHMWCLRGDLGDLGDLGDRQRLEVAVGSKIPTILWGQKPDRRGEAWQGSAAIFPCFHGDLSIFFGICWAYNTLYLTINH